MRRRDSRALRVLILPAIAALALAACSQKAVRPETGVIDVTPKANGHYAVDGELLTFAELEQRIAEQPPAGILLETSRIRHGAACIMMLGFKTETQIWTVKAPCALTLPRGSSENVTTSPKPLKPSSVMTIERDIPAGVLNSMSIGPLTRGTYSSGIATQTWTAWPLRLTIGSREHQRRPADAGDANSSVAMMTRTKQSIERLISLPHHHPPSWRMIDIRR